MAFVHSEPPAQRPVSAKIVVSGGFGVGKTTLVGSVSEIKPLRTEAAMTSVGRGVDDASQVSSKTTTTVAMDFGKLTVETGLVLYLFGTPGQDRFGFMWDDVVQGALGAIVLVDTRRLDDCYAAVDYFENRGLPFVVACNHFDGGVVHDIEEVRVALDVNADVPIFMTDAREPWKVRDALLELLEHVLTRIDPQAPAPVVERVVPAPVAPGAPGAHVGGTPPDSVSPMARPEPFVVSPMAQPEQVVPAAVTFVDPEPVVPAAAVAFVEPEPVVPAAAVAFVEPEPVVPAAAVAFVEPEPVVPGMAVEPFASAPVAQPEPVLPPTIAPPMAPAAATSHRPFRTEQDSDGLPAGIATEVGANGLSYFVPERP